MSESGAGLPTKTNEGRKYRRLGVMRLPTHLVRKNIEKNLTLGRGFDIMYIESERDDSPLGLEMRRNVDVQHFATIASKGLKVIHMV